MDLTIISTAILLELGFISTSGPIETPLIKSYNVITLAIVLYCCFRYNWPLCGQEDFISIMCKGLIIPLIWMLHRQKYYFQILDFAQYCLFLWTIMNNQPSFLLQFPSNSVLLSLITNHRHHSGVPSTTVDSITHNSVMESKWNMITFYLIIHTELTACWNYYKLMMTVNYLISIFLCLLAC